MSERVGEVLERKRGDTVPDVVVVLNPASPTVPLDISGGYSYILTVNTEREPDGSVGTELFSINGDITDAAAGVVEFEPTYANSDQLPGRYWYDVQQTDPTGRVKTIAKNRYIFYQDITKNVA